MPAASTPIYAAPSPRYRSLQTLMLLAVIGSVLSSIWLMPSRLERVAAATERGDQALLARELEQATHVPPDPGEARALVNVALMQGAPDTAAAILEQALARKPDNLEAIRLLLEVQRQRHKMPEVAKLDERLYALTLDPDALRAAADLYASLRMTPERIDALQRLNAAGRANAADIVELDHRLAEAGAGDQALALTMPWLEAQTRALPPEVIGMAAWLSMATLDANRIAGALGTLIGRFGVDGPLYVLIQTYAERGRPQLSLVAGRALGAAMQARPDVALTLAQLEAAQGQFASARQRLDDLDRAGQLMPAGVPMLMELSLQVGDFPRAVTLAGSLTSERIPEGLPLRLVEAVYAGQPTLLARLSIEPMASVSPGSGAVIALAHADRARAAALAEQALGSGGDLNDLGAAFASVVRALGLERAASARLLAAARSGSLNGQALALLLDFAGSSHVSAAAVLQGLRAERDTGLRAGALWAAFAARQGNGAEVASWIEAHPSRLPTEALISLLTLATEQHSAALAHAALAHAALADAAAAALMGRSDLPDGWSAREIALTARALEPMTLRRARDILEAIGSDEVPTTGRERLIASLVGAREFAKVAQSIRLPASDRAVVWLVQTASGAVRPETLAARLTLLASIAPQQALEPLARSWLADPPHLLASYVVALLDLGQDAAAREVLAAGLREMAASQQDMVLQEALARVSPRGALPILRAGAALGRPDWVAGYQEGLARAGLLDALRADLQARAAAPGAAPSLRRTIASRLVELNDRDGAIAILKGTVAESGPDDPNLAQLLYLWGPRADPDAIAWTRRRALTASIADLPKWLEHLSYLAAPRAVVDIVQSRPAVLSESAAAVRTYDASLNAAHIQVRPDLHAAIATATQPDRLVALAQLSSDTGQAQSAWLASRAAVAATPSDAAALLLAAQSAAALHRPQDAASLYTRLLAFGAQPADVMVDAGDALLTAKQPEAARRLLDAALAQMASSPTTLTGIRLRARTLILLGRRLDGSTLLKQWLARYPNDAGLRADLLQIDIANRQAKGE